MTKFTYKGKYNGDPESLPAHRIEPTEVQFREQDDLGKLGLYMNIVAIVMLIPLLVIMVLRAGSIDAVLHGWGFCIGALLAIIAMVPHEFIHGLCFNGEVEMYQNLSQGMLFVTGAEEFSKGQFVFMSMAPNLVFGFVPFIVFLICPKLVWLGVLGAMSIVSGTGDYYNVLNCARQVPKGCPVYMRGFHSYWYRPEGSENL